MFEGLLKFRLFCLKEYMIISMYIFRHAILLMFRNNYLDYCNVNNNHNISLIIDHILKLAFCNQADHPLPCNTHQCAIPTTTQSSSLEDDLRGKEDDILKMEDDLDLEVSWLGT